jgi:transcriptional regulator with XRE-family HTH domain
MVMSRTEPGNGDVSDSGQRPGVRGKVAAHGDPTPLCPPSAAVLADARARLGSPGEPLSQEDAAHAIGVSVVTYGRWERGERRPTGAYAKAVAKALKIDEAALQLVEEPAEPLPPSLEDAFYEMRARLERMEGMLALLVNAHAADLGVAVQDPATAFAEAMEAGLTPALAAAAESRDQGPAPRRGRRARAQRPAPTSTSGRAA